jgi:hypothetical protein
LADVRYLIAGLFGMAAAFLWFGASPEVAGAQVTPAGAASPSPSPAPTAVPPKRFRMAIDSYTSGTNQQFVGPGISPPQGPAFAAGSPVAPGTPYDFLSGGPETTGEGISQAFLLKPTYSLSPAMNLSVTAGYGSVGGSGTVAEYWGEETMPPLNAHLGQNAVSVPPTFTTHNGQDSVNASRLSILSGTLVDPRGNAAVTAGWFNLHQTASFVFQSPPATNTPPELVPQLPESLSDGAPSADVFKARPPILPLHGYDGWLKANLATFEFADADLPAMASAPARVTTASMVLDHGGGLTYTAQIAHVREAGTILTTELFGSNPTLTPTAQGAVPSSFLTGQRDTIVGAGATFNLPFDVDAEARYGYSCYTADGTTLATSHCTSGNYYYGKLHHGFAQFDLGVEFTRFEAAYAPTIMPYGTIENIWSPVYAFPDWFKTDYHLVDVTKTGANRQGVRVSSSFLIAGVEVRVSYASEYQIQKVDPSNVFTPGFVENYFLPQLTTAGGTLGREQHAAASFAWHPKFADVTLDLTDDTLGRAPSPGNPQEAVSMNYPAGVFALSRALGEKFYGSLGAGRYAVDGSFDNSGPKNADLAQSVIFAGLQFRANANSGYWLQYGLWSVHGTATTLMGPSPAYHGPQIMFDQRFKT